jgi:hypothetical protein
MAVIFVSWIRSVKKRQFSELSFKQLAVSLHKSIIFANWTETDLELMCFCLSAMLREIES